jgi:hypothetical protein
MMSDNEVWKNLDDFHLYEVSSLGRVRNKKSQQILRPGRHSGGYLVVRLYPQGKVYFIHALVCEAFHGKRPLRFDVAHNDGQRDNNAASNLRWASRKDNFEDKKRHGTQQIGIKNPRAKLTNGKVEEIIRDQRNYLMIANFHNISRTTVRDIKTGRSWGWLSGIKHKH